MRPLEIVRSETKIRRNFGIFIPRSHLKYNKFYDDFVLASVRFLFFIILILLISVGVNAEDRDVWILVDTKAQALSVMKQNTPIKVFRNISIGRNGANYDKRAGDDTTPLGSYRIGWVNENSRYHLFFGLSYPSMHDARRALFLSAINMETYRTLVQADIAKRVPRQNTTLGGVLVSTA